MSRGKRVFVVYGYASGQSPIGEPAVQGFGRSDKAAYADAKRQEGSIGLCYYFVRSNGDKVPARGMQLTGARARSARAAGVLANPAFEGDR